MTSTPKCIDVAIKELEQHREKIIELLPHAEFAEALVSRLNLLNGRCEINNIMEAVDITFSLKKISEAASVLRELAKGGYRQSWGPNDYGYARKRVWTCGKIRLEGTFPFGKGEHCRYVQTGVTEEPVFKLQCPDGEMPGDEIPPEEE